MMNFLKKTLKILSYIMIGLMAVYLLILVLFPTKVVDIAGFKMYHVASSSMDPKYKTNDVVFVVKTNKDKINVGDIITFEAYVKENGAVAKKTITHYVGAIEKDNGITYFKTQTYHDFHQSTNKFDEFYDQAGQVKQTVKQDIIGSVLFGVPLLGHVILFLNQIFANPFFILLIIINIGLIIFAYQYYKKTHKKDRAHDENI